MTPSKEYPGYYERDGMLYNSQGLAATAPTCLSCQDAKYQKVLPLSRRSSGPADWELLICPECAS